MPEIRNEVPSDAELAEYLDESLRASTITLLTDRSHRLRPEFDEAFAYLESLAISAVFLADLKSALYLSLQRLNRLPRSDPFWINTNLRPTLFKLVDFCNRRLSADPGDVDALLTETAGAVLMAGRFSQGRWTRLWTLKAVSLEWITFGAMFTAFYGPDNSRDFAQFIATNGVEDQVLPHLQSAARANGTVLASWVEDVLAELSQLQR